MLILQLLFELEQNYKTRIISHQIHVDKWVGQSSQNELVIKYRKTNVAESGKGSDLSHTVREAHDREIFIGSIDNMIMSSFG